MNINKLRKELKTIGYTVKTKKLSDCKFATYATLDGDELKGNIMSPEQAKTWEPLFKWGKENKEKIEAVKENESESFYPLTGLLRICK